MGFVATILAGGEGKRMRSALPKVLHLFNGKPMLARIIEQVSLLHPDKIFVVTGKYHTQIIHTLSQYININDIRFIDQPTPFGTGNAIYHCLEHYAANDNVLIVNGDMPMLTASIIENLMQIGAEYDGTITTAKLENPTGYGRIVYDDEDNLYAIVEESSCTREQQEIQIVNAGIYYFKAKVLKRYIPNLTNNNMKKEYYLTDIIRDIHDYNINYRMTTYMLEDKENIVIRGVNTPEELEALEYIALKHI